MAKHLSTVAIVLTLFTEDRKHIYAHTISSGVPGKILTQLMGKQFRQLQPIDQDYTLTIKAIKNKNLNLGNNGT